MPLLLLLHDSPTFLTLLSTRLPSMAVVYAIYLLLSQLYWWNLIYCPVFPGAIHYIDYWRPAESSLPSIFFCQLLWRFYYSSFIPFPTIFGHVAPLPTHVACPVSSSSFIYMLSLSLDDSRTTQCECLGRTRWSSPLDWTTYLYYFYKWLYTTSPRSHVLLECSTITCPSRMFYNHMSLSRDMVT